MRLHSCDHVPVDIDFDGIVSESAQVAVRQRLETGLSGRQPGVTP